MMVPLRKRIKRSVRSAIVRAFDPGVTSLVGRTRAEGSLDTLWREVEAAIRAAPAEWVWVHEPWKAQPVQAVATPLAKAMPKTADLSSG